MECRKSKRASRNKGFTMVEMIVALFIIALLGAIMIGSFYNAKTTKSLDVIADGLAFTINLARNDALGGKYGQSFGIFIASTSYSYFPGSSFDPNGSNNKITVLPDGWRLSTSTADGSSHIIFMRLSGIPQTTATVTVSRISDPSVMRQVTVGKQGSVSVIK